MTPDTIASVWIGIAIAATFIVGLQLARIASALERLACRPASGSVTDAQDK